MGGVGDPASAPHPGTSIRRGKVFSSVSPFARLLALLQLLAGDRCFTRNPSTSPPQCPPAYHLGKWRRPIRFNRTATSASCRALADQGHSLPSAVLYKLIILAVLMAVAPIGTYFGTLRYVWDGECGKQFGLVLHRPTATLSIVGL